MSIEDFVRSMPKVELHVHLEGAFQKERLLVIAEQNEIAETTKRFKDWVALLEQPDVARIGEIIEIVSGWMQHPDDLSHIVYELGVHMAKQNIRYAEVMVNPTYFTENGWSFEQYLAALNDGRSRAERGWGIKMRWVLSLRRDQPRHADDLVRWASSATGQNGGIVGIELGEPENAQPIGQFERAIRTAEKKEISRTAHAGLIQGAAAVIEVLEQLEPTRLVDAWGIAESPETRQMLIERQVPVVVSFKKALCHQLIKQAADYPLRQLYDDDVTLILGTDMPFFYQTSLNEEYLTAVQSCGLEIDELELIALNAVESSQLPPDEKTALVAQFRQEYAELREAHLSEEVS